MPVTKPKGRQRLARYQNLRSHRDALGWSLGDLLARLDNTPSEKSLRRLENGEPIRASSAFRVFHKIRAASATPLDAETEIEIVFR